MSLQKTVPEAAEIFGVTPRQIYNWINDANCPSIFVEGVQTLVFPDVLQWFVSYQVSKKTRRQRNLDPTSETETVDEATLRKTRAEADLKELQIAREKREVLPVDMVERGLVRANKAIQTQILGLPAALAPQLVSQPDRMAVFGILDRACRSVLTNLATMQDLGTEDDPGETAVASDE